MSRAKTYKEREIEKKLATRDLMKDLPEYCERHGYIMPAEFLIAVMNGVDPRTGGDVFCDDDDLEGSIRMSDSMTAASTLAKYLYVAAAKVEVSGETTLRIPEIKVTADVADSLVKKLKENL